MTLTPWVHGPVELAEGQVIEDRRRTVDPYNPGRTFYLSLLLLYCDGYSSNSTWLDSTGHIRRVELMHFGCVELVEEHSSTRSTRRARLARHVELDWLDTSSSTGATCNLVMIIVIHLLFNKLFTD